MSFYVNILINFELFPKSNNGYFLAYLDYMYGYNLV